MKKKSLYAVVMLCAFTANAGGFLAKIKTENKIYKKEDTRENKNLLDDDCFDKMVVKDITYAIFGESSPTNGIKVDISKPEATISGFFQPKNNSSWIFGLDFTGGVTDKNFSLFKGKKTVNAAFEIKPVIHFIPDRNKTKYIEEGSINKAPAAFIRKKKDEAKVYIENQVDSFYIMEMIYCYYLSGAKINAIHSDYKNDKINNASASQKQKDILLYFIRDLVKTPIHANTDNLTTILSDITPAQFDATNENITTNYNEKIIPAYYKYKKLFEDKQDNLAKIQIENAEDEWTQKKYKWFTFAPFFKAEKTNQYYPEYKDKDKDTTYTNYFKKGYLLSGGSTFFFNYYVLYPKKVANYFKIGTTLSYNNNLSALSSFNYEVRDSFFTKPGSVTQKVETGSAYTNAEIKNNFAAQMFAEYYLLPLNTFIPGFYVSTALNLNKANKSDTYKYKGNDIAQLALEGGVIFNINNKDKDKSILSLSAYVRFEDVTDNRRTKVAGEKLETKDDYLDRNLSYGLKVGIPIKLPDRK